MKDDKEDAIADRISVSEDDDENCKPDDKDEDFKPGNTAKAKKRYIQRKRSKKIR